MELKHEELEQIKKTKSVDMKGNRNEVELIINGQDDMGIFYGAIRIPIKRVFQVKRGLESYVQKYYRRKK